MPRSPMPLILFILMGGLILIFGVILADTIIDVVTTVTAGPSIGSFAGASAIGGLIPFVYFTMVIMIGVGMIVAGNIALFLQQR